MYVSVLGGNLPNIIIQHNLQLSNVLDHQVAADEKGDFLYNFLSILIIFIKMTWVNKMFVDSMWKSNLKLFGNEHFLLCNKALITIDLNWLKSTQHLAGSPLYGKQLPVVTNIGKGWIDKMWEWMCCVFQQQTVSQWSEISVWIHAILGQRDIFVMPWSVMQYAMLKCLSLWNQYDIPHSGIICDITPLQNFFFNIF